MEVQFPNNEAYEEGWKYCMRIGIGFSYSRPDLTVTPEPTGIKDDDKEVLDRLKSLAMFGNMYDACS